ncbi:unnamed protein product [Rhizophagus irregularis]|nr:unnamed protein product [Rhizophagus irregularis]
MSKRNSRARQLSNARKIQAEKYNSLQQLATTTYLELTNDNNYQSKSSIEKLREKLVENIRNLPANEVKDAYYLFQNMKYQKGKNQGKIFSIYIQNKAIELLKSELYKHTETKEYLQKKVIKLEKSQDKSLKQIRSLNSKITKLHKKHISKVNSYGRKLSIVTNAKLKSVITKIIKENKKEFSPGFKLLTTQMIQAGTTSIKSTVKETKLFYEFITGKPDDTFLSIQSVTSISSKYFAFGIMADETINAPDIILIEVEDFNQCNANSIANAINETFKKYSLQPNHFLTFLSDNTNYMSGVIDGAVVKFNQISGSSTFRIPCTLHVLHIILTNFEEMAFGKTSTTIGFSKEKHPFNLLYLAWELHDGYNKSNKESPLGMKAKYIQSLYQSLLGQSFSKYQQPLHTRWFYELEAAQQYLKRRSLHIEFASWFISKLKSHKKTSKLYFEKWELFSNWLQDPNLNIQIECLVQFGTQFYKPFVQFIAG